MKAVITWRQISAGQGGEWRRKVLDSDGPYFIGRSRDNFIHLDDLRVSRKHLSLQPRGDQILVTDYGSANGAFMDGAPFKSAIWRPGHKIQVADYEFHLAWEAASADSREAGRDLQQTGISSGNDLAERGIDQRGVAGRSDRAASPVRMRGLDAPGPAAVSAAHAIRDSDGRKFEGRRFEPESAPPPVVGRAGAGEAHLDPQAVALAVAAQRAREQEAGADYRFEAPHGARSSGARRLTQPSRRALRASGLLVPSSIVSQILALFAIVVTSMVMTVKVIVLSVSSKTEIVENKAREVLSIFGIEIARDGEGGSGSSLSVDPWAFTADIEAYQWLVFAALAIYAVAIVAFVVWHVALDRSLPFGFGQSVAGRIMQGPAVWLVPVLNLVQPPRIFDRVYAILLGVDPVGMGAGRARALVWAWWLCLIAGGAAMAAGALFPPERLDAAAAVTMIAGPLLVITGAALAVVLVRDMTGRIVSGVAHA